MSQGFSGVFWGYQEIIFNVPQRVKSWFKFVTSAERK
jgi:hypothetical protein